MEIIKIDDNTVEVIKSETIAETRTIYKKNELERSKGDLQGSIDSSNERMKEFDDMLAVFSK